MGRGELETNASDDGTKWQRKERQRGRQPKRPDAAVHRMCKRCKVVERGSESKESRGKGRKDRMRQTTCALASKKWGI